jgi:DNA polymerase
MITLDKETKSYADLKKVGTWAYSEDLTTDVICSCWGVGHEPIQEWWPDKYEVSTMPYDLKAYLEDPAHCIEAHHVAFERSIWANVMVKKYGWVLPRDEQWRDTMAVACYYALPAGLAKLAYVLRFEGKDPEGGRLITKYSKLYLKRAKTEIPDEDFKKFVAYCVHDVKMEQSISDYLGALPDRELAIFQLDQKINLRGLHLDTEGIQVAAQILDTRVAALVEEFKALTGFNPAQTAKIMEWFKNQGLKLENLQAGPLQEVMDDGEIPSGSARRALEIRLAVNKASTKKLDAMVRQRGVDNRARFQTRYHGAVTGRWTGSGFQPLNLRRNDEAIDPEDLVRDIMHGDASWLDTVYGDAMDAISKASRHWIMAAPKCKIYVGDFASIEAVILACLAEEKWKIHAFREGVKLYEYMADKIYRLAPGTVTKATHPQERQDGKTGELAFGYQGALGAWLKFDNSGRHSDEIILEICQSWRHEHPHTVAFWYGLQRTAIDAARDKAKEVYEYKQIRFQLVNEWLTMILPNGKRLWYWKPEVRMQAPHYCQPKVHKDCELAKCGHEHVPVLSYMAQKTGQWLRVNTYGGKLAENACQAVSREILVDAMMRAEAAGYGIILSVYDEIVAEVPEEFGNLQEFLSIMKGPLPDWCHDWPIGVDGWEGQRYKK